MFNDKCVLFNTQIKESINKAFAVFNIKKGKHVLISKRLRDEYIKNNSLELLKSDIYKVTNFLPSDRNLHERIICILNDITECKTCLYCNTNVKLGFNGKLSCYEYRNFCSIGCVNKSEITKQKIKTTNLKTYGCEYSLQTKEVIEKRKQTNLILYGVENAAQSDIIKTKHRQTIKERYNVENISQIDFVKFKKKQQSLLKYGTNAVFQSDVIKQKSKETNLRIYGTENVNQNSEIKRTGIKTKKTNYFNNLLQNTLLTDFVEFKFDLNYYLSNPRRQRFLFNCKVCNTEFRYRLTNTIVPKCPKCNPVDRRSSISERELFTFIKSLCVDTLPNQTGIIGKRTELDIYIPSNKIAVEFNGLYWHGEFSKGRKQNYHLDKTLAALNCDIILIHIFEDEYKTNKTLVHRIVKRKLGIYDSTINLNECTFQSISETTFLRFINKNSFLYINSKYDNYIGIKYKNQLVGCYSTNDNILIDNLVILPEYNITNLIDKFHQNKLLVDMRFGCEYLTSDFNIIEKINPTTYYVIKDMRFNFTDIKFKQYDDKLSLDINLQLNKIDKIYDCGKFIYSK